MRRVKVPKYQKNALNNSIKRYAHIVALIKEGRYGDARWYYVNQTGCALCCVTLNCGRCVLRKACGNETKDGYTTCVPSWRVFSLSFTSRRMLNNVAFERGAKLVLKDLRWIKRNQL